MNKQNLVIDDVCNFVGGSQPPKKEFLKEDKNGYVRLIQTRDYKTEAFRTYIPKKLARRFCNSTDIMIGRYGPPIFQILRGLEGAYNVALLKAIPKDNIRNEYLYYFLSQDAIFHYVEGLSKRTGGQTGVDLDSLRNYPIKLPDFHTQDKIVELLGSLDRKIKINSTINQDLEAMAKLIYAYWFVQFDFSNENGRPYKSSGGRMVLNEKLKREIPIEWTIGSLDNLGEIVGGSTPSKSIAENFTLENSGKPWITPKDLSLNKDKKFISKGELNATYKGIKAGSLKILPKGTVLLSSRAPIGYLAIARNELTTNQGFKSFIPRAYFTTEFIYYTLQHSIKIIEAYSSGSTFKEVSASVLKTVKTVIPPQKIIEQYNKTVGPIFHRQDLLEQENHKLSKLRDWLLPMLMNGQVTVGDAEEQLDTVPEKEENYG